MNITESKALEIIEEINRAREKWKLFAKEAKVDQKTIEILDNAFIVL